MRGQSQPIDGSDRLLERIYETAPVGLCFLDTELRIRRINVRLAATSGRPASEQIGRRLHEVMPSLASILEPALEQILETSEAAIDIEVHRAQPSDVEAEQYWLCNLDPVKSDDGRLVGITLAVQDITALKQTEQETRRRRAQNALEQSEQRLRLLLETTHAIPWTADAKTFQFTYVGPQAVQLLGYPLDQWHGHDFWPDHVHPDDRQEALDHGLESSRCLDAYQFEYRMIAADGRIVWIDHLVSVVRENGEPTLLQGFMIDISKRKQAEEELKRSERRFRQVLQSAPDAVVLVRPDGIVTFANDQMEGLFGYSRDELVGQPVDMLIPPRHREKHLLYMARYFAAPQLRPMAAGLDLVALHKDGRELPVEISLSPLSSDEGQLTVGAIRDVSDQRRAEEEKRQLREEIAHVSRVATMGELAASVAHELNQPLSAIVSNAQAGERLIRQGSVDLDELRAILEDVAADGLRGGQVIRRLRALLRKGESERQILDMSEVAREVLPLVRSDAIGRSVSLEHHLAPGLPPVAGDRIQLQQVLFNLIMNGFEAMDDVAADRRTLTLETSLGEEGTVRVVVRDSGAGLDSENIDRIFEPFYTTKPEGMGMGLAINRSIIEAHGGRLWATPNADHGASFGFTLPADEVASS